MRAWRPQAQVSDHHRHDYASNDPKAPGRRLGKVLAKHGKRAGYAQKNRDAGYLPEQNNDPGLTRKHRSPVTGLAILPSQHVKSTVANAQHLDTLTGLA